jgi:hypothetical protein
MSAIKDCLAQIGEVREAAADPAAAYLIRSRLQRMILSCERVLAREQDSEVPALPGQIGFVDEPLGALCRKIRRLSAVLCQPSESFDVRWSRGWEEMAPLLEELEIELRCSAASL